MKILVDIPDNKALSFLDVLRSISYVKAKQITDAKAELMADIRESVEELKQVKQGKLKARAVEDLFDEL